MKNFRNTLQCLFFIVVLLPFWMADICYFLSLILGLLPRPSYSVINLSWHFAAAYPIVSTVIIIISLIADIVIYAVKKSREK